MPATRGPRIAPQPTPQAIKCWNCGHSVTVTPEVDVASCSYCANVWNWKKHTLVRGQR